MSIHQNTLNEVTEHEVGASNLNPQRETEPINVLVSGLVGGKPEPLTKDEYVMLRTCLDLSKSDDKAQQAIAEAIRECEKPEARTLKRFLWNLCGEIGEQWEEVGAMLTQGFAEPLFLHDLKTYNCEFDEAGTLAAFLTVLRAGGWFARWLDTQVRCFADREHNPAPTPLQMMSQLTLAAAEFEEKLGNARHILQNHWDALGFPGVKPPDPAEYGCPADAPADPKKQKRTGKPGRGKRAA